MNSSTTITYHPKVHAILEYVKQAFFENGLVKSLAKKFKYLVIQESQKYRLDPPAVYTLASVLGIQYEKVNDFSTRWIPSICPFMHCVKYTNPDHHRDYVLYVPLRDKLSSIELVHHTPKGFASAKVFQKMIPSFYEYHDLEELKAQLLDQLSERHPTIMTYNDERKGAVVLLI